MMSDYQWRFVIVQSVQIFSLFEIYLNFSVIILAEIGTSSQWGEGRRWEERFQVAENSSGQAVLLQHPRPFASHSRVVSESHEEISAVCGENKPWRCSLPISWSWSRQQWFVRKKLDQIFIWSSGLFYPVSLSPISYLFYYYALL